MNTRYNSIEISSFKKKKKISFVKYKLYKLFITLTTYFKDIGNIKLSTIDTRSAIRSKN